MDQNNSKKSNMQWYDYSGGIRAASTAFCFPRMGIRLYAHELRLEREGYDNVENLINADAVDLAVRTSFSYTQLQQWIDQATLAAHLREDYPGFVARTGIEGSGELCCFLRTCDSAKVDGVEKLVAALSADRPSRPRGE